MSTNNKVYEIVTDQVIAMLERGTVPWHQPWDPAVGVPISMSTSKGYRGINPFILAVTASYAGYSSPWWGTYEQIAKRGGQVRKGEKATLVTFWKRGSRDVTDDAGETQEKQWAILRYFRVFNADQADWTAEHPAPPIPGVNDHEPIVECEQLAARYVLSSRIRMTFSNDGAWYSMLEDRVNVPPLAAFETPEHYYSALFHELTHSTGHKSRLDREGITEGHRFGDVVYSREELVAEMGAAMLCGVTGIEQVTIEQNAAYLANWLRVLKGDAQMIVSAAAAAQRASDLILGVTFANGADAPKAA